MNRDATDFDIRMPGCLGIGGPAPWRRPARRPGAPHPPRQDGGPTGRRPDPHGECRPVPRVRGVPFARSEWREEWTRVP